MMQEGHRFGYACAEAIIFGVILLFFSLLQMRISKYMKQA
jgi:ABC-type sugar transport system permease subunit